MFKAKSKDRGEASQRFYITLYGDSKQLKPVETWQVNVHWLRKVDLSAIVGQASEGSVVLRGLPTTCRSVCAYSSHPDELQVQFRSIERQLYLMTYIYM